MLERESPSSPSRERAHCCSPRPHGQPGVVVALADRDDLVRARRPAEPRLAGRSRKLQARAPLGCATRMATRRRARQALAEHAATALRAGALLLTDGVRFSMDGDSCAAAGVWYRRRASTASGWSSTTHGSSVRSVRTAAAASSTSAWRRRRTGAGRHSGQPSAALAHLAGSAGLVEWLVQRTHLYLHRRRCRSRWPRRRAPRARLRAPNPGVASGCARTSRAFARARRRNGLPLLESQTPIQPVMLARPLRRRSRRSGLAGGRVGSGAIRPPTVPRVRRGCRVTLSATHREADVDALLEALAQARDMVRDDRAAAWGTRP